MKLSTHFTTTQCCRKGEETSVQSNSDQNDQRCVIYEVDGMKQILSLTECNKQHSPKRTDPVDGTTFVVLYNYKRRGLRDLDLKKGDLVTVTSYNKEDWSLVYLMTNQLEGLVPSNYIVPFTGIEDKL
jgi:SH3 domain